MGRPDYDVFIDLSAVDLHYQELPQYLDALARDSSLASAAASTILALPEGWELPPEAADWGIACCNGPWEALHRSIHKAASLGHHLVLVLDSLLPYNEVLRHLIEAFDRDPMFGMVQPRFADTATDHVWPLPDHGVMNPSYPELTRAALSLLPDYTITPEFPAACMVIRREVVMAMDTAAHGPVSTIGKLRLLLCQFRRRGFRNLVVNHAVLPSPLPYARVYPALPSADMDLLNLMYPDIARADAWTANLPQRNLETLLARACADDARERRRMLLDCRGMTSTKNGTSQNILGLLDGFHALDGPWQIDVLTSVAASEYHQLPKRCPQFRLLTDRPDGAYTAGVLLNQPRDLSTVAELHRHALLVAFNMLDTISWDILYVCDEKVDSLWRFIARFSDGLFYNSQFTRERFNARFPLQSETAERVLYLSMAEDELVDPAVAQEPVGDYILIFGNEYDHKDIWQTLRLLVDAFPFAKIVVVGIEGAVTRNVIAMPSGQIDRTVLHRLLAGSRVIVFPSFYEGFGMPVVEGLAYGRTVIVRESPLWHEIAARLQLHGQMVPFDSVASLVEAVGCALAGLPLKPLPQGTGLRPGGSPIRWRDCAQQIIDLMDELLLNTDGRRWQAREEALRVVQFWQL